MSEEPTTKETEVHASPAGRGRGRARKTVERFNVEVKEEVEFKVAEGKGTKLGEIGHVQEKFQKFTRNSEELKKLYHLVFGKVGKLKDLKAHLKEFSGLVYSGEPHEQEADKAKCAARASKWSMPLIKNVIDALGVDRSAASFQGGKAPKRDDLLSRLLEWLECPNEGSKKKRSAPAKSKAKAKSTSKKTPQKKTPAKSKAKAKRQDKDDEDDDEEDNEPLNKKQRTVVSRSKPLFSASRYMLTPAKQKEQAVKNKRVAENRKRKGSTAAGKKRAASKKAKKVVSDDEDEEEDDVDEEDDDVDEDEDEDEDEEEEAEAEEEAEEEQEAGADDDEEEKKIRASIGRVMSSISSEELSIKKVRAAVAEDLGMDVSAKKQFIKEVVMQNLSAAE